MGVPGGDARAVADGARDRQAGRWSLALAFGACVLAVLVRSQLAALFGALASACSRSAGVRVDAALAGDVDGMGLRRRRRARDRRDRRVVAFLGHRSNEWETATTLWKGRMVEYGSWAGGAFAIGVGVLPAIALLAVLAVPARSGRDRACARSSSSRPAPSSSFGWYAAIKGAYLSTTFSSLIVERNLMYLTPLAMVATAYLLERAAAPIWAVVVAGAAVLAMIVWVPIDRGLDNFPYYEAHGLAILALANREWAWPRRGDRDPLVVLHSPVVRLLLTCATPLRGRRRGLRFPIPPASPSPSSAGTCRRGLRVDRGARLSSLDRGEHSEAERYWVDPPRTAGSAVILGQRMSDSPLGFASTSSGTRSIDKVWSVDGTGRGPGHTLPDLQDVDGTPVGPAHGLRPRRRTGWRSPATWSR